MKKTIIAITFLLSIFSCWKEEPQYNEYLVTTYQQLLDNLVLDCPSDTSEYYFKATIAGQPTCYFDGVDGRKLKFYSTVKFTTPSPSFNTGNLPNDVRNSAYLDIKHKPTRQGEDFVRVKFPDYDFDRDLVEYLDSLFAIEIHELAATTEEADIKFEVELSMIDMKYPETDGGIVFPISTRFGNQDDSYIRFRKVEKTLEQGYVYYYIEMEVECSLYHWPQNGKEGLWGKIENGILVAKFKAV